MRESDVILYADSSRGVYIPQYFAESIKRELVTGVSDQDWKDLELDPYGEDSENYWWAWESVLDNARVHYNGKEYLLFQDGDLFLISEDEIDSWLED